MDLHILIAIDYEEGLDGLVRALEARGASVTVVQDGQTALEAIMDEKVDACIAETLLPGLGGKELAYEILGEYPGFPLFFRTRNPTLEDAFQFARLGAMEYSGTDVDAEEFAEKVIAAASGSVSELFEGGLPPLRQQEEDAATPGPLPFTQYRSRNEETAEIFRTAINRVAKAPTTVLIQGESGTGKELLARTIHHFSPRAQKQWVAVNCAALSESLIESELFGHEKGSFTGASSKRVGRFEQAHEGTFFLDEVGDLSPAVQTKLLRVIQEKTIERVGGNKPIPVDVRLIAATHRNLKRMVEKGKFREDLFWRLSVITLELPPLRERPEDVPGLAQFFIERYRHQLGRNKMPITPRAMKLLTSYHWPGNVRELENVIERCVVLAPSDRIDIEDLPKTMRTGKTGTVRKKSLKEARADFEKEFITRALQEQNGNVSNTADIIGLARKNLQEKIKRYGIDVDTMRAGSDSPPDKPAEDKDSEIK